MHQERRHSDGPQPWSQFHREERCEACLGRCVPEREKHDRFPSIKGGTQSRLVCGYRQKKAHRPRPHQRQTNTVCSRTQRAAKSEPNSVKQLPDGTTVLTLLQQDGIPVECFNEFTDFVLAHSDEIDEALATAFLHHQLNGTEVVQ